MLAVLAAWLAVLGGLGGLNASFQDLLARGMGMVVELVVVLGVVLILVLLMAAFLVLGVAVIRSFSIMSQGSGADMLPVSLVFFAGVILFLIVLYIVLNWVLFSISPPGMGS